MKTLHKLKDVEILAVDAVGELLRSVSSVQVESVEYAHRIASNLGIDGRIRFRHGGASYQLIVEVKSDGAPRNVRSGVFQLKGYMAHLSEIKNPVEDECWIPLIASRYLSEQSRTICRNLGVGYLDLLGNVYLEFGDVYIDRVVAAQPKSETRALRSLFTPKASSILRAMIRDPSRPWRVVELAEEAHTSLGHVSNVRKALLSRELIETRDEGVVLSKPTALVTAWRENYRQLWGNRIKEYTRFHGRELVERLRGKLRSSGDGPRAILAATSAADWLAPFVRDGTHAFYADEPGTQLLRDVLEMTPAAVGPNVLLCQPFDTGVFDDAVEASPGIFCTSPVVTYLDLWNGNDRHREAAKHLAGEFFPWLQ